MIPVLPAMYDYLLDEPSPRILVEAIKEYGTIEAPGDSDNQKILAWAKEIGAPGQSYNHDSIPWCGLFMSVCAIRAKQPIPNFPLWALSWKNYGTKADTPMLGDVMVYRRDGGGHVAIYVGEDKTCHHILGGNQKDSVCIVRKPKKDLYVVRRTLWKIAQPSNVRRVHLNAEGAEAGSEA